MASRATGALLGLVAAVLFATSVLSPKISAKIPAWWDGHPTVDGKTYDRMDGHVGMLGAARCFDGERCTSLEVSGGFAAAGYGELGLVLLAELMAIALTISIWTIGDRRRGVARAALVMGVLAGAGSAVMVLIGPGLQASQEGKPLLIEVPIGTGLMLFWVGLAANAAAAIIAPRVKREPLRLKTSMARPVPQQPFVPQQPDFREMLREQHDSLRPSVRGPEPMIGAQPQPSNRGSMPPGSPLFEAAPQLRPLYDMQGAPPPVVAPVAMPPAPEPLPRASMRQLAGIDTPSPERTGPPSPPVRGMPSPVPMRSQPPTQPPRGSFVPPPLAPPPTPIATQALERNPSPSQPPPLRVPTLADSPLRAPGSAGKIPARAPGRTQPPPARAQRPTQPTEPPPIKNKEKKRTLAISVPPPPSAETSPPPPKLPARAKRVSQAEPNTAVEIDAEAKARAKAASANAARAEADERAPTAAISGRMGAATPISTAEERAIAADGLLAARGELGDVSAVGDHTDQVSAAGLGDVEMNTGAQPIAPPPPADAAPADTGTIQTPPEPSATSEIAAAPEPPAESPEPTASHPLSTAPSSLPPPKSVSTPSGPTPACPQCEAPMAWVEEHLRFYCKQCRMYF